jgi:hypothetical protein
MIEINPNTLYLRQDRLSMLYGLGGEADTIIACLGPHIWFNWEQI